MATASSAMNDHRTLSPISEHPIRYPSPAAPGRTRRSLRGYAATVHAARFGLHCGAVEAVGRDGLRRRGVDGSARQRTKSTALGPALEPIRVNYCRFFVVFSLSDAVVDPID